MANLTNAGALLNLTMVLNSVLKKDALCQTVIIPTTRLNVFITSKNIKLSFVLSLVKDASINSFAPSHIAMKTLKLH